MTSLWILLGLAGLLAGSRFVVDGARRLALGLGVPTFVVGATVAAVGTSLPEIATNVGVGWRALRGEAVPGIAVGNVVGSCLSQITLLVGLTALAAPLRLSPRSAWRDGAVAVAALAGMAWTLADGVTTRGEATALVVGYAAYVVMLLWPARSEPAADEARDRPNSRFAAAVVCVLGLALVLGGAELVVGSGVELARASGVSATAIGLGVGIATGLPELAIALRGVADRETGLAVGNLLGSNITDPLLSFGLGALVHPVAAELVPIGVDFAIWGVATIVVVAWLATRGGIGTGRAIALLAAFLGWLTGRALDWF